MHKRLNEALLDISPPPPLPTPLSFFFIFLLSVLLFCFREFVFCHVPVVEGADQCVNRLNEAFLKIWALPAFRPFRPSPLSFVYSRRLPRFRALPPPPTPVPDVPSGRGHDVVSGIQIPVYLQK